MDLVERAKAIPPLVWVGVAAVLLFVFFLSKGSSGSTPVDDSAGGGGDGGGDFAPDIDQELSNLFALVRADTEARAAWQQQISSIIKKSATPTPTPSSSRIVPSDRGLKTPAPSPAGSGATPVIPRAGTRGR